MEILICSEWLCIFQTRLVVSVRASTSAEAGDRLEHAELSIPWAVHQRLQLQQVLLILPTQHRQEKRIKWGVEYSAATLLKCNVITCSV